MIFKSIKPTRTNSILVAAVLSIVVALPVMSQPLGIATVISRNDVKVPAAEQQIEQEAPITALSEPEEISYKDDGLSRSQNDLPAITGQTAAAGTEVSEPGNTEKKAVQTEAAENPAAEPEISERISQPALSADFTPVKEPLVFEPVDKSLYITATSLNLRAKADIESEVKAELAMGTKVRATADSGEWLYVASGDVCGFISSEYTSSEMVFVPVEQTRYVKADKLNLRETFSDDAAVVEVLNRDAKLVRTGVGDGWSRVKTAAGNTGYVVSDYLTEKIPASLQPKPKLPDLQDGSLAGSASREKLVAIAKSGIGVPYVYGGSSLSGFDCSGFTSWVYRQVGINIPRSTSGYYNAGVGVSLSEAKPGDIICMDANNRDGKTSITHVGVYIGSGQMLHASTSKQRIVSVNANTFFGYGIKLITVRRFVD